MISKILVPTDGSETSQKAIEYAVDFAKQTGAGITFLSVIDRGAFIARSIPADATPTHIIEPIEEYLRQAAEAYLKEAVEKCREKGVKSTKLISMGHPVEEIINEAEKTNVDLIIIGSHGRSAIASAVLGSVTFGIIHKETRFPVLVIRR
ncbi:MAG: universal stress protein [Nitrospiraceae bacterium]|nr:MAG: universal stress protein [Nitrospiraceae bacterium]